MVGALILFLWQFLSNAALDLHRGMQQYTPKQAEILNYLNEHLEEGFYFLPNVPEGTSAQEEQKAMEDGMGKPWAQIYFHKSMTMNMGLNLARGFIIDFVIVLLICWILQKMANPSAQTIMLACLSVALISYLSTFYLNSIWYETKTLVDLLDGLVSFGALGAWLAWWLKRQ